MRKASFGGGTNGAAMIIECLERDIDIDVVLFADTGGEKPETYAFVREFEKWCKARNLPFFRVQSVDRNGTYVTLEQRCLNNSMLPSLAYGYKACSQRHKRAPQDKFMNSYPPARAAWANGEKVECLIGYDADEMRRAAIDEDEKYVYRYPLIEFWMDRQACVETIERAGLPQPGKSACFFCPASSVAEIQALQRDHPKLAERALAMERGANLDTVKGLGRGFSWANVLSQQSFDFPEPPEMDCGCFD